MSDRVALLQAGHLLQVGAPSALYSDPANMDVARFIGSPEINIAAGERTPQGVRLGDTTLPAVLEGQGPVHVGIRPEAIRVLDTPGLLAQAQGPGPKLTLIKRMIEDLGPEVLIHGHFPHAPEALIRVRAQKSDHYAQSTLAQKSALNLMLNTAQLLFFDADGARLAAKIPDVAERV